MARCMSRYLVVLLNDLYEQPENLAKLAGNLEDEGHAALAEYLEDPKRIPQRKVIDRLAEAVNKRLLKWCSSKLPPWLLAQAALFDREIAKRGRSAKAGEALAQWNADLRRLVEMYRCWGKGLSTEFKRPEQAIDAALQELWLNLLWLLAANELSETDGTDAACDSKAAYRKLQKRSSRIYALESALQASAATLAAMHQLEDKSQGSIELHSLRLFVTINGLANRLEQLPPWHRWNDEPLKDAIDDAEVFKLWDAANPSSAIKTPRNLINMLEFATYVDDQIRIGQYSAELAALPKKKSFPIPHLEHWRQPSPRRRQQ